MIHLKQIAPPLMGGLMGLMMLRMAHGIITQENDLAGPLLIAFVLAHFVVIGVILGLVVWSARYAPGLRERLNRLHRPSWRHLGIMSISAIAAAFAAHLIIHGGL